MSQQHKAYLRGSQLLRNAPVVQIIPQSPIADAKLQVLQDFVILKDVQGIEHVVAPAHIVQSLSLQP